jgi:hypothetical protein
VPLLHRGEPSRQTSTINDDALARQTNGHILTTLLIAAQNFELLKATIPRQKRQKRFRGKRRRTRKIYSKIMFSVNKIVKAAVCKNALSRLTLARNITSNTSCKGATNSVSIENVLLKAEETPRASPKTTHPSHPDNSNHEKQHTGQCKSCCGGGKCGGSKHAHSHTHTHSHSHT